MNRITIDAYAKINLSLDVLHKREDGYHELSMIMQQIDLKDILTIEEINEKIEIESNSTQVPLDTSNLVYKAWKLLSDKYNIQRGVRINIEKNIPVAAGLAGGSSNAAATLKGLNQLWNLKLSLEELMDIGLKIGADVPYCLLGGTALAEGIGEKLTRLKDFPDKFVLLANPGVHVPTAYVYKNLNLDRIYKHPETDKLIKSIENNDEIYIAQNMINVLETVTIPEHPVIEEIKENMIQLGAIGSLMSGSGPTVFGIFDNEEKMMNCMNKLKKNIETVIATKTV